MIGITYSLQHLEYRCNTVCSILESNPYQSHPEAEASPFVRAQGHIWSMKYVYRLVWSIKKCHLCKIPSSDGCSNILED